jgi:beta-phosphoglucomutase
MVALDIRGLIFDLDGVITDTAEFHYLSWKRVADDDNIPFTREDNEALRGVSRRESLNRILKGAPISDERAERLMRLKNDYYQAYLQDITPAHRLPGVTALLDEAKAAGLRLGIGSASRNARVVLERLELIDYFDAIGDGYSVVHTKPAPDLFLWTAGRMNVTPPQTIVFEDAEVGIDAALAGGFWAVGVGASKIRHAHLVTPTMDVSLADILDQLSAVAAHRITG